MCAAKTSDFVLADGAVVMELSDLNTVTVDVENKVRLNYSENIVNLSFKYV